MANLNLKKLPALNQESMAQMAKIMRAYRQDCYGFCSQILRYDAWSTQREIMDAVSKPYARVAVKACHASGKTSVAARIVLWFTYTGGICITTAPTWTQVRQLLWQEIAEAHDPDATGRPLGGNLSLSQTSANLRVNVGAYAFGLSTNEGVRFQGFHARQGSRMLIVLDEAPGVKPEIWEAIEGIRTGGDVRILALGNPVIAGGQFFDAFGKDKSIWQTFTIDAFDSPNLAGLTEADLLTMTDEELRDNPRPYLITKNAVRELMVKWGTESPIYQARVRGRFPTQSDDMLFSLSWLEMARVRELPDPPFVHDLYAGIDVAGPGEAETVVVIRHGPKILETHTFMDAYSQDKVLGVLEPYKLRGIEVNVDAIGQGWHFAYPLIEAGYKVNPINVGVQALDSRKYFNFKAESYWKLRERFQTGQISGLVDDETIHQLSTILYEQTDQGKIKIEGKKQALKRGVESPDRAEALMLAFVDPYETEIHDVSDELYDDLTNYTYW